MGNALKRISDCFNLNNNSKCVNDFVGGPLVAQNIYSWLVNKYLENYLYQNTLQHELIYKKQGQETKTD